MVPFIAQLNDNRKSQHSSKEPLKKILMDMLPPEKRSTTEFLTTPAPIVYLLGHNLCEAGAERGISVRLIKMASERFFGTSLNRNLSIYV